MVPTMYVVRGGNPVRINVADYDGKEPVSDQSHFVPPGVTAVASAAPLDETPKPKGGKNAAKNDAPVATGPTFVGSPKSWQGANGLIYTQADSSGKFWRIDDKSVPLIATPFDSETDAAAAPIA